MVTGLAGGGLVLQNNGSDDVDVTSNSAFWFPTRLESGKYNVTVSAQPSNPTQTCTVSGGSGSVNSADVSTIVVNCASDAFTLGGTVTGLTGSVVLENSNGEHLTVTASGTFAFPTTLVSGANYRVSISSQPDAPSQYCVVTAGTGTVANANVTTVAIACATDSIPVTGTLVGLRSGDSIVIGNGADAITLTTNGGFAFATPVDSGSTYDVVVTTQPATTDAAHDPCTVTNGSGVATDGVDTVSVVCPGHGIYQLSYDYYASGGCGDHSNWYTENFGEMTYDQCEALANQYGAQYMGAPDFSDYSYTAPYAGYVRWVGEQSAADAYVSTDEWETVTAVPKTGINYCVLAYANQATHGGTSFGSTLTSSNGETYVVEDYGSISEETCYTYAAQAGARPLNPYMFGLSYGTTHMVENHPCHGSVEYTSSTGFTSDGGTDHTYTCFLGYNP